MNIVYSLLTIMMLFIITSIIAEVKLSKEVISLLVISLIVVATFSEISEPLTSLFMLFFLVGIVYKEKHDFVNSIIIVFLSYSLMLVVDSIISNLFYGLQLGGASDEFDIRGEFSLYLFFYILVLFSGTIIIFVTKKIIKKSVKLIFSIRLVLLIASSVIFMFGIIFINAFYVRSLDGYRYVSTLTNIFIFILFTVEVYFIVKGQMADSARKEKELELTRLQEYTDNIELFYNELRRFKHDYTNILTSMTGYMYADDMEGLKNYYSQTIQPFNSLTSIDQFKLGRLSQLHILELKGIISTKLIQARDKGIIAEIEIQDTIDHINMGTLDLSVSVGILLDNAIEAAMRCDSGKVIIALIKNSSSIVIKIDNTYCGDSININEIMEKGHSTKGESRGLGLYNYKLIIDKYENILMDIITMDNIFSHTLTIMNEEV